MTSTFHQIWFAMCLLSTAKLKSRAFIQRLLKAKQSSAQNFLDQGRLPRHPAGCTTAVSSSFLFSFGLAARGRRSTHHLPLVQTLIQVSRRANTAQNPHFPDVLRLLAVAAHRFQTTPEKAAVLHCAANEVKGSVLFISWTDLLRKGIPWGG